MKTNCIGIDFDNTMVCYDVLFHELAIERDWIPRDLPAAKDGVRDHLRENGREDDWIELQALAYGSRILEAPPFSGVVNFLTGCHDTGVSVFIISHKTQLPNRGPRHLDLHLAAWSWLKHHQLLDTDRTGLKPSQIYFEPTRQRKFERIAEVQCSWFVDDLPEFLSSPEFPSTVDRVLFDPNDQHARENHFRRVRSWDELDQVLSSQASKVG